MPEKISTERRLAEFALGMNYSDLTAEAVSCAKRLLLDTLGCAFGAVESEPSHIVQSVVQPAYAGPQIASVINGARASLEHAIAVNGVLVRYLDYNDIYVGQDPLHPSEIIPIALAACEEKDQTGEEFLATLVAGYEVELRINDAVGFLKRGYHPLSAAVFAAPLVLGKAWGLSSLITAHAVGISGSRGFTSFVINKGDISMMKAFGHAWSALDAVLATRLAMNGFTGPSETLDWVATSLQPAQDRLDINLDPGKFRIPFVGIKRYPLQYEIQAPVEAAATLHKQFVGRLGSVRKVVIGTYERTIGRVGTPDRFHPKTREAADHSMPICVAMALLTGDITPAHFDSDVWRRPDVLELAQKIEFVIDAELQSQEPNGRGASLELVWDNQPSERVLIPIPQGDAARPLSDAELKTKFFTLTVPVIGAKRAEAIADLIDVLERLDSVSRLTQVLRSKELRS